MTRALVFLAFCCCGAAALAQQPSARPLALAISGRALSADGNAVLRRARVDVTAGGRHFGSVLTDDRGSFTVEVFGGGPFIVTVGKGGYAFARATLSREELANPLTVRLPRGGAVGGVVVDQDGVPLIGAFVTAARVEGDFEGYPAFFSTSTDDRGAFRIAGLIAGRYEIAAGPPTGATTVVAPIPGTFTTLRLINERSGGGTVIEAARQRPLASMTATVGPDGRPISLTPPPVPAPRVVSLRPGEDVLDLDFVVPVLDSVARRAQVERVLNEKGQTLVRELERPFEAGRAAGIRGRVTSESGQPILDADVQVIGANGMTIQLRTGANGAYFARGLTAGSYTIRVAKSGYATVTYGQRRAQQAGRLITVATDQTIEGVDFIARRGDAISGLVVDEHGEPLQGAIVQALQVREAAGRPVAIPASSLRRTDDRGQYRIHSLLPGTYIVATSVDMTTVGPGGAASEGSAPIYFPGTPLIDAAGQIALNGDMTGANLVFAPARGARVRGAALDAEGPLVAGTARLVTSRRTRAIALDIPPAALGDDGSFFFPNVPPGEYAIQVRGDGPGRTGMFGLEHVSVGDRDPAPVTVRTSRGATLEGRFVIEGDPETPLCQSALVDGLGDARPCASFNVPAAAFAIAPVSLDPDRASVDVPSGLVVSSEGTFYATSLSGAIGFVMRRAPSEGWFLKSVTIGGLDITDTGFDFGTGPQTVENAEIVVSRRGATITGRVRDGDAPAAEFAVVVFPTLRDQWGPSSRRLRFVPPSHDGSFRVAGLPHGDYYVAAVDRLEGTRDAGEWQSADVLGRLVAGAERITIREGESHVTTLRLLRR